MAQESARHNIGAIPRTLNTPTVALHLLRGENHARSSFRLAGRQRIKNRDAAGLAFNERSLPRMIVTPDEAPATGRVWIEPPDGTILRTEPS